MSDLKNDLINYFPENTRNSQEFRDMIGAIGTVMEGFRGEINNIYSYVDPLTIPEDKIDLLANHIGVKFVTNIAHRAKREYLYTAMQLFKANGTEQVLKYIFSMVGWDVYLEYAFDLDNSKSFPLIQGSRYVEIDSWTATKHNDLIGWDYKGWENLKHSSFLNKTWFEADLEGLIDEQMTGTRDVDVLPANLVKPDTAYAVDDVIFDDLTSLTKYVCITAGTSPDQATLDGIIFPNDYGNQISVGDAVFDSVPVVSDRMPSWWTPKKKTINDGTGYLPPSISDGGEGCDELRFYKSGGDKFALYMTYDIETCASNPDALRDTDSLLWGRIQFDEYGSQWADIINADGGEVVYPINTETYKVDVPYAAPRVEMLPYIRIRIERESYEMWSEEVYEGSDRFGYTAEEVYNLSKQITNFFLEEVRPTNVRIIDIAVPTGLRDDLALDFFKTAFGMFEIANTEQMLRYNGLLAYGYDHDPYKINQFYQNFAYANMKPSSFVEFETQEVVADFSLIDKVEIVETSQGETHVLDIKSIREAGTQITTAHEFCRACKQAMSDIGLDGVVSVVVRKEDIRWVRFLDRSGDDLVFSEATFYSESDGAFIEFGDIGLTVGMNPTDNDGYREKYLSVNVGADGGADTFPYEDADDIEIHGIAGRPERDEFWRDYAKSGEYGGAGSGVVDLPTDHLGRHAGDYDYYNAIEEWGIENGLPTKTETPKRQIVRRFYKPFDRGVKNPTASRRHVYLEAVIPEDREITFWLCPFADRTKVDINSVEGWHEFKFSKTGYQAAELINYVAVAVEIEGEGLITSKNVLYRLRWISDEPESAEPHAIELDKPIFDYEFYEESFSEEFEHTVWRDETTTRNLVVQTALDFYDDFIPQIYEFSGIYPNNLLIKRDLLIDEDPIMLSNFTDDIEYGRLVDGVKIKYSNFLMVHAADYNRHETVPETWQIIEDNVTVVKDQRYFFNNTDKDIIVTIEPTSFTVGDSCLLATHNTTSHMVKLDTTGYRYVFEDGSVYEGRLYDIPASSYLRLVCTKWDEIQIIKA